VAVELVCALELLNLGQVCLHMRNHVYRSQGCPEKFNVVPAGERAASCRREGLRAQSHREIEAQTRAAVIVTAFGKFVKRRTVLDRRLEAHNAMVLRGF
jgi:hypothetical protein